MPKQGNNVKGRSQLMLNLKKPVFWVAAVGVIIIGAALIDVTVEQVQDFSNPAGNGKSSTEDPAPGEARSKSMVNIEEVDAGEEIKLPDFRYEGTDPIEQLVYATETEKNAQPERGFTVVASKIFGSYEEDGQLKVFVTTFSSTFKLYGRVLKEVSGSVVPAAITYQNDDQGHYVLLKYEQAKDGALWMPSIKEFCRLPVSGKRIPGLADRIINHYADYEDLRSLRWENLAKHLQGNGIQEAVLYGPDGEVEFSLGQ